MLKTSKNYAEKVHSRKNKKKIFMDTISHSLDVLLSKLLRNQSLQILTGEVLVKLFSIAKISKRLPRIAIYRKAKPND